jgi:hypothetical protein
MSHVLVKNDFSLDPRGCGAGRHRGGGGGALIMNFSAAFAERIQCKFF